MALNLLSKRQFDATIVHPKPYSFIADKLKCTDSFIYFPILLAFPFGFELVDNHDAFFYRPDLIL
ncbi:hypothetical protein MiSe_20390 [Microseira wollei NIES-4236]|uniref:Uncharacterized protein n=1 Tax=Microseira wollei NIES-4236 TaxID=2530354 RepID=A0AAV3X9H1_9CYAN|nr:hypothetical protein MiSe_20390 [Microseira wollei NIES-4236]